MKTAKEQTEARLSPRPKRAFLCCQEGKEGGRVIGLLSGQSIKERYKITEK